MVLKKEFSGFAEQALCTISGEKDFASHHLANESLHLIFTLHNLFHKYRKELVEVGADDRNMHEISQRSSKIQGYFWVRK